MPHRYLSAMIDALSITLVGAPRSKPRPRFIPGRRRPVSLTGKAKTYALTLEARARDAVANLGGADAIAAAWSGRAIVVDILCTFPTRNTTLWGELHTVRPDADNLAKMAWDCLQKARALGGDDSRVASGNTTKVWGPVGGMTVTVRPAGAQTATRPTKASRTLKAAPDWLR